MTTPKIVDAADAEAALRGCEWWLRVSRSIAAPFGAYCVRQDSEIFAVPDSLGEASWGKRRPLAVEPPVYPTFPGGLKGALLVARTLGMPIKEGDRLNGEEVRG